MRWDKINSVPRNSFRAFNFMSVDHDKSRGRFSYILPRVTDWQTGPRLYRMQRKYRSRNLNNTNALILFIQTLALYKSFTYLLNYLLDRVWPENVLLTLTYSSLTHSLDRLTGDGSLQPLELTFRPVVRSRWPERVLTARRSASCAGTDSCRRRTCLKTETRRSLILLQMLRCWVWPITDTLGTKSNQRNPRMCRKHDIWNASSFCSSDLVNVHVSAPYSKTDTYVIVQSQLSVLWREVE